MSVGLHLKNIVIGVVLIHLFGISFYSFSFSGTKPSKARERVVVKTVSLNPAAPVARQATPSPSKPVPPKPVVAATPPPPKPVEKKVVAKKKPVKESPVKKEEKAIAVDARTRELLQKAQQSISKIDTAHATLPTEAKKSGALLAALKFDPGLSEGEAGYIDEVGALLKALLRLPERGDVEVELALNRSGGIVTMHIVHAKSDRNKKYIESSLKEIRFPPFGKHFQGEKEHTFKVMLSDAS